LAEYFPVSVLENSSVDQAVINSGKTYL